MNIQSERQVQRFLQLEIGGQTEVFTPVGRIDLLTDTEIIEIKESSGWKSAIGQVISYGQYYPDRNKVIYLYGKRDQFLVPLIEETCQSQNISVKWHPIEVEDNSNKLPLFAYNSNLQEDNVMPILEKKKSYLDAAYNFRVNQSEMDKVKELCFAVARPVSDALNEYIAFAVKTNILVSSDDIGVLSQDETGRLIASISIDGEIAEIEVVPVSDLRKLPQSESDNSHINCDAITVSSSPVSDAGFDRNHPEFIEFKTKFKEIIENILKGIDYDCNHIKAIKYFEQAYLSAKEIGAKTEEGESLFALFETIKNIIGKNVKETTGLEIDQIKKYCKEVTRFVKEHYEWSLLLNCDEDIEKFPSPEGLDYLVEMYGSNNGTLGLENYTRDCCYIYEICEQWQEFIDAHEDYFETTEEWLLSPYPELGENGEVDLSSAIKTFTEDDTFLKIGWCYFNLDDADEGIKYFQKAFDRFHCYRLDELPYGIDWPSLDFAVCSYFIKKSMDARNLTINSDVNSAVLPFLRGDIFGRYEDIFRLRDALGTDHEEIKKDIQTLSNLNFSVLDCIELIRNIVGAFVY